ncbi:MAG TPA: LptE family protein [Candidatus Cloacimonas sp.]|jgi:outer membrane lipopolysaccharide assembly protein LptE/RlpB|nr:LptE family protein [Candidatus Cloacimonas sp.]MDD2250479.1 LptE family protein [Candidatus Cloacimonadota bacterium]MCK9157484.1 LPS assembly lipoprotein LptE [Candidatus Cloacimonas sp.]MCK9165118.1 LPS assembly lipoprotein LptE [Candidatus Cloacimonas sp.]MDD3734264.1 LptE family protein [Candidatus Cloacimonadota bacterium]
MVKKFIYPVLLLLILSSCFYSVYSNAYPHLRKIRILAFENRTSEYGLGDKLLNYLNREIRNDGRLKIVTEDPDCTLEGAILSFSESVYSYDTANQIQDYQLTMVVSVTFTDLINNTVLYENNALTVTELYAVAEGGTAKFKTKEEAVEELIAKLYRTVLQNSIEGW